MDELQAQSWTLPHNRFIVLSGNCCALDPGKKNCLGTERWRCVSQRFSCLVSVDSKWKCENLMKEHWLSHCTSMEMLTNTVSFYGPGFPLGTVPYTVHISSRKSKNDHWWPCTTKCGVASPAKAGGKHLFLTEMLAVLTRVFPPNIRRLFPALP